MNPLALVFALLVVAAGGASAQFRRVEVPVGPRGTDVTIQLFMFDARNVALKIIDQGGLTGQTYRDLNHAMVSHHCIAGCNGGPFTRDGSPLGLVIADGKSSGTRNTSSPTTAGVLFLDGTNLRLQSAAGYFQKTANSPPRQLLQSGPFLIENSQATAGLSDRKFARRSFILTDGKFRWAIGSSPTTTLQQLARALANPDTFNDFNVLTALALDSGSSTALWVKQTHHPFYLKELDPVRNFIGLVRR